MPRYFVYDMLELAFKKNSIGVVVNMLFKFSNHVHISVDQSPTCW